ncbi:MAG: hypothetical protein CM1200mP29_09590 [Verrucomicrobiota bacterium]|nr:MAG: hypothetical protein CM1200mP29_09590 [Verrucomicrobiota bacterium]
MPGWFTIAGSSRTRRLAPVHHLFAHPYEIQRKMNLNKSLPRASTCPLWAKRYLASPWRLGRKAIEVCSEKWQTQPELASGMSTGPCPGKGFDPAAGTRRREGLELAGPRLAEIEHCRVSRAEKQAIASPVSVPQL